MMMLDNNWIGFDMLLVNKVIGVVWLVVCELVYYYGWDGGESWFEGSCDDEVVFFDILFGIYYLMVDVDLVLEKLVLVCDMIEVLSGGVGWLNFVMVMIFFVIFLIFMWFCYVVFEVGCWVESDYVLVSSDDVDEDD